MDYAKFYFKDYRHDTRGLDPLMHGVYLLLLFEFLESERPLPDNFEQLCCLAEARTGKEMEAVRKVLRRFWIRLEDGWIQKNAFVIITDYRNGVATKSANGKGIRGERKAVLQPTVAKRTVSDSLAECGRMEGDSLGERYRIKSESLAVLINQESVISNHKSVTSNHESAAVPPEKRTAGDWANFLHPLYGRRDAEMEAKGAIVQAIDTGTDPKVIEAGVRAVAAHVLRAAPGGWGNGMVATGRRFWTEQQWRSPEAFAQRWDDVKKNKGAAGHESAMPDSAPCGFVDEPAGWRVLWPERFDFPPPERWLDIPLSDRRVLTGAALEWQKTKAAEGEG